MFKSVSGRIKAARPPKASHCESPWPYQGVLYIWSGVVVVATALYTLPDNSGMYRHISCSYFSIIGRFLSNKDMSLSKGIFVKHGFTFLSSWSIYRDAKI